MGLWKIKRKVTALISSVRFCIIVLLAVFSGQQSYAQSGFHGWGRMSVIIPHSQKIVSDLETQFRTLQRDEMDHVQTLSSFRWWLRFNKDPLFTLSVSPFAFFSISDRFASQNELRTAVQGEWKLKMDKHWSVLLAEGAEVRLFCTERSAALRLRNRFSLDYQFDSRWAMRLNYELLFQTKQSTLMLNQTRLNVQTNCKCNAHVDLQVGYYQMMNPLQLSSIPNRGLQMWMKLHI